MTDQALHVRKKQSRLFTAMLAGTLLLGASTGFAQTSQDSGLAQRRAAHLRHGINLSEWFAQVYDQKGYTKEHFETWTTAQDIALIKSMGFDHVRLSVIHSRCSSTDRLTGFLRIIWGISTVRCR